MKLSEYIKNNGITYSEYFDVLASRTKGVKSLTDIKKQQRVALKLSINELNNDYNKLYDSYNSRFFDENGNFKNSYGKTDNDSKFNEFLNAESSLTDKIEKIQTLLVENQNVYEENTVNNIQKILNEATEGISKMSDTYKFYSQFHTETDYNNYLMNNISDTDNLMTSENVAVRKNAYEQSKARLNEISEEIKQLNKSNNSDDDYLKTLKNEESKLKENIKKYERFQGISDNYYIPEDDEFISNSSKRNYKNATKTELQRCDAEYRKIMYKIEYQCGCFDKNGNITRGIGGEIIYPATEMSKAIMNGNIDDIYNSLITDKYGFFISADKEEIEYYPFALDNNNEDSYYRLLQLGDINAWNYMTKYEVDRYYQKLNTEGQKEAYKYLEDLTPLLTYRETQERTDDISNLSNGELVWENVLSVPKNIFGGILAFSEDSYNYLSGNEINPYSRAHSWSNDSSAVRNTTAKRIEEATDNVEFLGVSWGDVYQAAMSSVDSVAGSFCFGKGYTVIMGMGAASRKAKELYDQGASNKDIAIASLSSGIIEIFFEEVSLDYFFDNFINSSSKSIAKNLSKVAVQAGIEMSEETFTEIANVVSDVLILGDRSKWGKTISEYKEQGYSDIDAITSTVWDIGGDVLEAGICGFISGGMMALGGTTIGAIKNSNNLEESYKLQIEMIEKNTLNEDIPLYISDANNELEKYGLSDGPIIMEQNDYKNFTKANEENQQILTYNVPYEFFENLPQYISEPVMVIDNGNRSIIITDYSMRDFSNNNSFVAVEIEKNRQVGNDILNVVRNVYPLDNFESQITEALDSGKVIVANKSKTNKMLTDIGIKSDKVLRILKYASDGISQGKQRLGNEPTVKNNKIINVLTGNEIDGNTYRILQRLENGETVTADEVSNIKEVLEGSKIVDAMREKFIAENPQFANMPPKDIGTYLLNSNERIELRNNIIEERLREGSFSGIDKNGNDEYNGVVEKGERLDIVIGLPAAGKSSAIVNTLSEFYQSAVIDSDIIKSRLPEFNGGWGAMLVHEESSQINLKLLEKTMETDANIVLPIVGSKIGSVEKYIIPAAKLGYNINIHLNELPNGKAVGRMLKRYFETGRFIKPVFVLEYGSKPTEVYEQIKKRDDISGYSRWSNDVEYGQRPKLIEISENNKSYGIYNATGVMQSQSSEITSTENRSDINGYSEERNDTERESELARVGRRGRLYGIYDGESGQSGREILGRLDKASKRAGEIEPVENRSDINGYSEERNDTERESELARVGRRGRLYGIYDGESGQSGRGNVRRTDSEIQSRERQSSEIETTEGASLTDGVFFDLNTTNAVTKPLESYPAEKQDMIKSYLNSVDENLVDLVERVKKGTNKFERVYISDVNAREANDIKNLLDIDVEGYTHNINTNGIRHILKRHGAVGNHDNGMSNVNDIARMGWVIENYDNIEILNRKNKTVTSFEFMDKNNEPAIQIKYSKKINGTYYLVEAAFENNYNKLWVQSAYLKKSESVTRAPDASKKTPEMTSETEHASPLSNSSISRNKVNVNQEYNKKSESVTQAHTASEDNLPYGHARSTPASLLSSDNVSRNDKNVNNKKSDENIFSIFTKNRDGSKVLSQEEIIKTKELAAAFDINVQFKDLRNTVSKNATLITPDGYIDGAGNIYINLYAQNPYNFVLKHELAHFGQDTLEYTRYVELVENTDCYYNWLLEITGESDLKRAERKFKEQLAEIDPNIESADSKQAKNELIAYFTADNIFNENGENIMNATMEIEPKHRNAFVRYVVNIIKRIKEKLSKLKWFKNTFADKEISVLENSFKKMVLQGNDKKAKGNYNGDTEYCFAICRDETKIKVAEQMRNENRSYADIYKEHQLIKDAYGNWLVELDTKSFKFFADGNAKTESHYYNNKLKRENGITEGKLKDFVAYKTLYESYPQLQDIRVVIKDVSNKNEKIRYVANANTIFINKEFYNDYKTTKNNAFSGYLLGAIQETVQYQDGRKSKVTLEQLKEYEKKGMLPYSESLGRNFTAEEAYNNFYDNYEVNLAIKRHETKKRLLKNQNIDELMQNEAYIPDIDYDEVVVFNSNGDPVVSDVNLEDKKLYQKNKELKSRDFGLRDIVNKLENEESVSIDDINSVPIIKKAYEESLKHGETYKNDSIERGKLRENLLKALEDNGSAVIDENGNTEYSGYVIQNHRADIVLGLFETGQMTDPISSRYGSRIISTDTVKTLLPEFNNGIGEASVQSESESIMTDMLDFAVLRGDNLVYSTVGNDYNSLIEKINYFKENGYSVYLHLNEISNNKAIAKSLKRYIETDRFVSPNSIFEYGDMPTENFNKIITEDVVDGYSHYVSDVSDEKGLVLKEITDNIKGLNKEFILKNKHLNTKNRKATSDNEVAFNLREKTVAKEQMKKELDIYKNSNKLKHTLYPERLSVKNDVSDIVNLRAGSDSLITNVLDKENSITDVFGETRLDELRKSEIKNFDELNALYSNEILEKFRNSILKNENGSLTSMYAVCRNGKGNIEASPLGFVAGSFESAKYLYSETREQISRNTPLYITEVKGNVQNPLIVPFELKNSNIRKFCEWLLENKYIKKSEFSEIARLKSAFDDFGYENHRSRKIRELVKSKGYDAIIYPNKSTDTGSVKIVFLDYDQVLEVAKNGVLIENNGISENYFDIENAEKVVTSAENTKKFNDFISENSLKIDGKYIPKKVKLGNSGFMEYRTINRELAEKVFERNIRGKQRVELSGSDTAKRNVVKNVKEICKNTVFKNENGDLISFVLTNKSGVDIENLKANECVFSTVENTLAEKENFYETESYCECYLNSYKPLFLQMNEWNVKDAAYCALNSKLISEKFYYSLFENDLNESIINENKITEKFIEHFALKGYDSIVFTNEKGEYKTIVFDKSQMIVISKNGKRISNAKKFSDTDITTNENLTELEYDLKGHSGVLENNGYNNLTAKTAIEILKTRKNNNISQTDTAGRNIEENVKSKLENSILKTKDGVPYSVFVNAKNRNTYNLFGQYASTLKAVQDLTVSEKIKRYDIKSSDFKENFANIENPYFITFDPLDVSVDEFIKYMHQDRIINNIEYVNIMSSWKMNDFDGATAIINTLKSRHFDSILFVNKNYDAGSLGLIVFDGENLLPVNATENQDNVSADSFNEPAFFDEKSENENFVEKSRAELIDKKNEKDYNDKAEREKSYISPFFWGKKQRLGRKDGKGFWWKRIKQSKPRADKLELQLNPRDESYYLPLPNGRCVQFENMINGVVQDCKCVINKKKSMYFFEIKPAFLLIKPLNEAKRQAEAAKFNGYKVQWLVSDQEATRQIARVFERENIDIEVLYYPEQE